MDVDETDVDRALLDQFSCMVTSDRDTLIAQFHKLVGECANERDAAFYLDMNNWNLQEAIGAYFDIQCGEAGATAAGPLRLTVVNGAGAGICQTVAPLCQFARLLRVRNSGVSVWPCGCVLSFKSGDRLTNERSVSLPSLSPGAEADVLLHMRSPIATGMYGGLWQAISDEAVVFADDIYVNVNVIEASAPVSPDQQLAVQQSVPSAANCCPVTANSPAFVPALLPIDSTTPSSLASSQSHTSPAAAAAAAVPVTQLYGDTAAVSRDLSSRSTSDLNDTEMD